MVPLEKQMLSSTDEAVLPIEKCWPEYRHLLGYNCWILDQISTYLTMLQTQKAWEEVL